MLLRQPTKLTSISAGGATGGPPLALRLASAASAASWFATSAARWSASVANRRRYSEVRWIEADEAAKRRADWGQVRNGRDKSKHVIAEEGWGGTRMSGVSGRGWAGREGGAREAGGRSRRFCAPRVLGSWLSLKISRIKSCPNDDGSRTSQGGVLCEKARLWA